MKTRTSKLVTAKANGNQAPGVPPSEEEIRGRAYEIFRARGGQNGQDLDDWVRAEQELKQEGALHARTWAEM